MGKIISIITVIILSIGLYGCSSEKQIDTKKIAVNKEVNNLEVSEKQIAPSFEILGVTGKKTVLNDYKGKTVVLNFFNTWNADSVKEMPYFMEVGNMYKDKGVEMMYVCPGETKNEVTEYIKNNPISNVNILLDANGEVAKNYKVEATPTTYIIDRDGNIFARLAKTITKEELINLIESVL